MPEFDVELYDAEIGHHFTYRHAWPQDAFLRIKYNGQSDFQKLHQTLAKRANSRPDNHEGYVLRQQNGSLLFIFFSDWNVTFSNSYFLGEYATQHDRQRMDALTNPVEGLSDEPEQLQAA
jgi:hypothetical protein